MSERKQLPSAALELGQLNEDLIIQLIENGEDESFYLEYKKGRFAQKDFNYDIRKTLATFANLNGGLILIGIKDKKNSEDPVSIAERLIGSNITEANHATLRELVVGEKIVCALN